MTVVAEDLVSRKESPEKPATELKVAFFSDGDGTRVELTHAGWESFADTAGDEVDGYSSGWETVLGRYASHVKG